MKAKVDLFFLENDHLLDLTMNQDLD